jgi:hypothetical protein
MDASTGITRRRFLAGSSLGVAAFVAACGGPKPTAEPSGGQAPPTATDAGGTAAPTLPPPKSSRGAWEELRRAVRGSPDHLPAEAERLVAAGDPDAIIAFVRDAITTYPAADDGPGDIIGRWRYGVRGTLRGGAGTPRDKAELLADMLTRSGRHAYVAAADTAALLAGTDGAPADLGTAARHFRRAVRRPFAPAITDDRLAIVRNALNLAASPAAPTPLDVGGADSTALADKVLAAIGPGAKAERVFQALPMTSLPVVIVPGSGDAGDEIAEPWTGKGLRPRGDIPAQAALPPGGTLGVAARVLAITTRDTYRQIALVEGSWDSAALIGRDIVISLMPAVDSLDALLAIRPANVGVIRPVITVRGPDLDEATRKQFTFAGKPITLGGKIVDIDNPDGVVRVGDEPIAAGDAVPDPAVIASAQAMSIGIGAATFPTPILGVSVTDAGGRMLEGLPAAAFRVTEDGKPVGFTVDQTHVPAPRVMFLIDGSDSIPAQFRGAAMGKVARTVAESLLVLDPRTTFRSAGVNYLEAASFDDWTADLALVEKNAIAVMAGGSDIWHSLADVARFGPTAVVLITDAHTIDYMTNAEQTVPPPEYLSRVVAGPPVFTLGVGDVNQTMLRALGDAGRLGSAAVTDIAQAVAAVRSAIESRPANPYRIAYNAPLAGAPTRTVAVALATRAEISANGTYEVPAPTARVRPPAIAGLYLEVDCGSVRARRTLAGAEPGIDPNAITEEHLGQVRAALFGACAITVEAGVPSMAVQLDDGITMAIDSSAIAEATDDDTKLAALATGLGVRPKTLHATSVALDDADGPLTFETILRMTLHRRVAQWEPGGTVRTRTSVDVLPHTVFATTDPDPVSAFARTARRTARLAFAEGVGFAQSTARSLDTASLVAAPGAIIDVLPGIARPQVVALARLIDNFGSQPRIAVVDKAATPAGWFIDRASGSLFGVLGDGSGGGAEVAEINRIFDQLDNVLTMAGVYDDIAALLGFGSLSLAGGVWLQLEAAKLKKLKAATIAIATMGDGTDPNLQALLDLNNAICTVLQEIAQEVGPALLGRIGIGSAEELLHAIAAGDGLLQLATSHGIVCG